MQDENFRAGYAAFIGRPNAGKSTLVNRLLRFPLAIVSPLEQTTRHKILGILNAPHYQLCLLDTPGYLERAQDGLQSNLLKMAKSAASEDADVVVLVVGPQAPSAEDVAALSRLADQGKPVVLAVNKVDLSKNEAGRKAAAEAWGKALPLAAVHFISALNGEGVDKLLGSITSALPKSPPYFPADQISDRWERFFAAEAVRSAVFEHLGEEVPHASAVVIEDFKERQGAKDIVSALICVERPTQKGIVIGKGGSMILKIRKSSMDRLQETLGRKVELELFVKVKKNWRKDPNALKELGYTV